MSAYSPAKKIGIMGGTFDPIHFGHLRAAEEAREALSLDEVIFIPAGNPPHKEGSLASAEDRYRMTVLATQKCPYFSVSRLETEKTGKCYTHETLKALKSQPEYSEAEMYFIVGFDSVLDIMSWKEPEELVKLCRLAAVSRSGYPREKLANLPKNLGEAVIPIEMPMLVISSTELRRRLTDGRSIRYLVPDEVAQYIKEKGLYV